jgi:hypothetical protein
MRNDSSNNAVQILEYVARRDPHHVKSFFLQESITSRITTRLVAAIMRLSDYLDDQTVAQTCKIGRDSPHWKL